MELRHLRYFIAVAEEQNVTRAAARLNVSQPPLSRQIRDLEHELGVALFERSPKSLNLTAAGRAFLPEVRSALQRVEEAVQKARAVAAGKQGELHVGYAPSLAVDLLPRALRAFQKEFPHVSVQLHDLSSQQMLRRLRDGKLDLALMVKMSVMPMAGLAFEEVERHAVCVAMAPTHSLAKKRLVSVADLGSERLICFALAEYPEYHAWIADLFANLNQSPRIAEEHEGVTSLIAAVESGRGVALMSERLKCMAGPRLKLIPLKPAPPPLVIGIARKERQESPIISAFISATKLENAKSKLG
ncbi:MAG TPA: LysR family transcriptional regulator [Methylomirabilota bacterium]|nr:LysR family transcriptional regulator [Methylomirabilota bacterium]